MLFHFNNLANHPTPLIFIKSNIIKYHNFDRFEVKVIFLNLNQVFPFGFDFGQSEHTGFNRYPDRVKNGK